MTDTPIYGPPIDRYFETFPPFKLQSVIIYLPINAPYDNPIILIFYPPYFYTTFLHASSAYS